MLGTSKGRSGFQIGHAIALRPAPFSREPVRPAEARSLSLKKRPRYLIDDWSTAIPKKKPPRTEISLSHNRDDRRNQDRRRGPPCRRVKAWLRRSAQWLRASLRSLSMVRMLTCSRAPTSCGGFPSTRMLRSTSRGRAGSSASARLNASISERAFHHPRRARRLVADVQHAHRFRRG